jgi:hypothetical protein
MLEVVGKDDDAAVLPVTYAISSHEACEYYMYPKRTHLLISSLTSKPNLPKGSPDSGLDSILGSH